MAATIPGRVLCGWLDIRPGVPVDLGAPSFLISSPPQASLQIDKHCWGGERRQNWALVNEWTPTLSVELGHVSQLSREKDLVKQRHPGGQGALGGELSNWP